MKDGIEGIAKDGIEGIAKDGIMMFEVRVGFVETEYGVRMVGACIIENGDVMVGVTLIVGTNFTLAGFEDDADAEAAAAPAPAPRFLRPKMAPDTCPG